MFITTKKEAVAMDAVFIAEGSFRMNVAVTPAGVSASPLVQLLIVYANSKTGMTFGTCPISSPILNQKTLDAFKEFIKLAEEDCGNLMFEGAGIATVSPASATPFSATGLPKGLGEFG